MLVRQESIAIIHLRLQDIDAREYTTSNVRSFSPRFETFVMRVRTLLSSLLFLFYDRERSSNSPEDDITASLALSIRQLSEDICHDDE